MSVRALVVVTVVGLMNIVNGCGGNRVNSFSPGTRTLPVSSGAALPATIGVSLTVRNSLPAIQVGPNRVRPNLYAYFCSPVTTDRSGQTTVTVSQRCIRLDGVISNGGEQRFFISESDLNSIYSRSGGAGAFEFADDQQITSVPWPCYHPNETVQLDSPVNVQNWNVEVNQRYTLSYGCLVDRS